MKQDNSQAQAKSSDLPEAPWSMPIENIVDRLGVSPQEGLSDDEVRARLKRFGPNRLRQKKQVTAWKILANQFKSLIIGILAAASLAAFFFGRYLEGFAVAVALVLNAVVGFFTELKATRSMEALQKLGKVSAQVRRNGKHLEISAGELVPGDLVFIESGDVIPADLRIMEAEGLQVNESSLTGESVPVQKKTAPVEPEANLADRASMLFKGTAITSGSGLGVVTATGMKTELGTIAELTQGAEDEQTPLEKRLEYLGRRLILVTIFLGLLVALSGYLGGKDWLVVLETALAMAVATVPEGLPVVATMALARGMWRMAKRNALITRLSAVETLGATTIICTDKTGTLTENRMAVRALVFSDREVTVDDEGGFLEENREIDPDKDAGLRRILETGALCNNAEKDEDSGDPMEIALLEAAGLAGLERADLLQNWPEEREEAFSTDTRMMATFHREDGHFRVAVKGAPKAVLQASRRQAGADGEEALDEEAWLERNKVLARRGLRLLGMAEKRVDSAHVDPYKNLIFQGLTGLLDPPRKDVGDALEECRKAGIRVIMVTGDHPATAQGISAAIGMDTEDEKVKQGELLEELDKISDEEREELLGASIFARVTPSQKLSLIELHQTAGEIVAMTGDGVNDAPALKKADIGISMGKRGTQVAKEAADMVLTDDRFVSIVAAVRYGRVIFNNIRKFIFYLISGNVSEVFIITIASLVGLPLPLLPLQILYINLIGDIFPALALGLGEGSPEIMTRPPRDPEEPILTKGHWLAIGGYALVFSAAVLGALLLALYWQEMDANRAVTVSFSSLVLARLWHVFNMREAGTGFLRNDITTNPFVWASLGIGLILLAMAIYIPIFAQVLKLQPPGGKEWLLIFLSSLIPLVVGQIVKIRSKLKSGKENSPT